MVGLTVWWVNRARLDAAGGKHNTKQDKKRNFLHSASLNTQIHGVSRNLSYASTDKEEQMFRLLALLYLLLAGSAMAAELPDIKLRDAYDESARLSDFSGKYVLLNVWATWCAPCVEEMPGLQRLQASMGNEKFTVLPISVEVGKTDKVTTFYQRLGLSGLPLYLLDDKHDMVRLKILGLPTTILLNPEGDVVWRVAGDLNWDDAALRAKLLKDIGGVAP